MTKMQHMGEHPDPTKRFFSQSRKLAGFWRECIFCAKGSTDIGPSEVLPEYDYDPNYVYMTIIPELPKGLHRYMRGQVYDHYWSVCDDCYEFYENLMEELKVSENILYRFFDKYNDLLYIGKSINIAKRLSDHRRDKHWFEDITKILLERFLTHDLLLKAERDAIISEHPRFNVTHNGGIG